MKNKERKNIKMMSTVALEKELLNASGTRKLNIINELTRRSKISGK